MSTDELIERIDRLLDITQRWLTIPEAQKYAKMSKNTLMDCINCGDIQASKKRGKWIIDRLSIDRYYGTSDENNLFNDVVMRSSL